MGFRPRALEGVSEGVSECRGSAPGGGAVGGLGLCAAEGGSKGRGLGLGTQQASLCLSGQGKQWPNSLLFLCAPPPPSPPGFPALLLDP